MWRPKFVDQLFWKLFRMKTMTVAWSRIISNRPEVKVDSLDMASEIPIVDTLSLSDVHDLTTQTISKGRGHLVSLANIQYTSSEVKHFRFLFYGSFHVPSYIMGYVNRLLLMVRIHFLQNLLVSRQVATWSITLESNKITLTVSKTIILSAVIPSIVDFVLTNRIAISTVKIINAVRSRTTVTHFRNGLITEVRFITQESIINGSLCS